MDYQNKFLKYKSKHRKLKQKINMKIMELKLKQNVEENSEEIDEDILIYPEDTSKSILEKENILELIKNLLENNSKVHLFITGKYASGKSTTTEKIKSEFKEYGVYIIELDNIIREYVKDKTNPNQTIASLNAFKVYKDKATEEETNTFIEKTKEEINKGFRLNNKLVIIEGALSSSSICKQLIGPNPLLTIYFQPTNPSTHKKRIVSRIISDIKNCTYTLPGYWEPNGIFDRGQIELDLIDDIDLEEKYGDELDLIVDKCLKDAEIRAEQIQVDFTNKSWTVIVLNT